MMNSKLKRIWKEMPVAKSSCNPNIALEVKEIGEVRTGLNRFWIRSSDGATVDEIISLSSS